MQKVSVAQVAIVLQPKLSWKRRIWSNSQHHFISLTHQVFLGSYSSLSSALEVHHNLNKRCYDDVVVLISYVILYQALPQTSSSHKGVHGIYLPTSPYPSFLLAQTYLQNRLC